MLPIGRAEVLFYAQLDVVGGLCSLDAPAFFLRARSAMRRTTMLWEVFVTRFEEAFGQYRRRRCPRLSVIARMLRQ
jgi:hypothetical protein